MPCACSQGLLALPWNKLKSLQIESLNNSRGESCFVNSVYLWIPYSVCKFYRAGKPPDPLKSRFQLPSTIKVVTDLKQKSRRILMYRMCIKARVFKKHIAFGVASRGHQDVSLPPVNLIFLMLKINENKGGGGSFLPASPRP